MTIQEFINKFGHCLVQFVYYHKYSFCFIGKDENGLMLKIWCCSEPNDTYEFEVEADKQYKISDLQYQLESFNVIGLDLAQNQNHCES